MVRRMLSAHPEVEIVDECKNGQEAILAIRSGRPDLVFLDVQMPEVDGFSVIENVEEEKLPVVIFVTAYDEYAIRAFETGALDYLLKPYDRKRFEQAFERAVRQIRNQKSNLDSERIISLLSEARRPEKYMERFIIKNSGRVFFLKTEEIVWIESEGNYVFLHTGQNKYLFRESIGRLEQQLDPQIFRRISRFAIVNLNCIQELHTEFRGSYNVILRSGVELKLSNRYRQNLNKFSGGTL
jgi:two-component system LytT family response regulator